VSADLDRLTEFDTGTLCETGATAFAPGLRPVWASGRVVGRALTVDLPSAQNLLLHRAVAGAEAGDLLVVRCPDRLYGYFGEVLAVAALSAGIVAMVIDGSVRDVEAVRDVGFPVFAAGTALPGTGKLAEGSVGAELEVRGARVRRGDIVVADESGVVVLAPEEVAGVLDRARARTDMERGVIARLRQGETTLDLLGFH
jgi:4-hydroxy-4-methyl-2-oxoglutarate aldolase